ncbi:MAG TPA: HAD family hydrolase [Chloroflexia bacterium]|nr:HAD family hydrolase [Chloroflexia bacterium]
MIRAVLFDFHNTLVTCDAWLELEIRTLPGHVLRLLRKRGLLDDAPEHSEDDARLLFRALRHRVHDSGVELSAFEGAREVLHEMGYHPPDDAIVAAVEELEYACLPDVRLIEGAAATLERLARAGCRLGIVSSAGFPPFVERALGQHDLERYFDSVVTSAGEGIYKSNPEIYRRVAERLGAAPEETAHVGDHARFDVATAKAAGLHAIWYAAHAERTARMHGADWIALKRLGEQADAVVMRLEDVPGEVERIDRDS